eukprot:TRINITY_DN15554_c0_g1_i1.p1 TRINITY_DN15554_c0_g1~~TRINITY_DN15554_c0_g1_i1.p1  ORF type:complete len:869 (-),score=225.49 TRINITY_DN15554_c0_g1_i1:48-2552(-)
MRPPVQVPVQVQTPPQQAASTPRMSKAVCRSMSPPLRRSVSPPQLRETSPPPLPRNMAAAAASRRLSPQATRSCHKSATTEPQRAIRYEPTTLPAGMAPVATPDVQAPVEQARVEQAPVEQSQDLAPGAETCASVQAADSSRSSRPASGARVRVASPSNKSDRGGSRRSSRCSPPLSPGNLISFPPVISYSAINSESGPSLSGTAAHVERVDLVDQPEKSDQEALKLKIAMLEYQCEAQQAALEKKELQVEALTETVQTAKDSLQRFCEEAEHENFQLRCRLEKTEAELAALKASSRAGIDDAESLRAKLTQSEAACEALHYELDVLTARTPHGSMPDGEPHQAASREALVASEREQEQLVDELLFLRAEAASLREMHEEQWRQRSSSFELLGSEVKQMLAKWAEEEREDSLSPQVAEQDQEELREEAASLQKALAESRAQFSQAQSENPALQTVLSERHAAAAAIADRARAESRETANWFRLVVLLLRQDQSERNYVQMEDLAHGVRLWKDRTQTLVAELSNDTTAQLQELELQCSRGSVLLQEMEGKFTQQGKQMAAAAQSAALEFKQAQSIWEAQMRKETHRRKLAEEELLRMAVRHEEAIGGAVKDRLLSCLDEERDKVGRLQKKLQQAEKTLEILTAARQPGKMSPQAILRSKGASCKGCSDKEDVIDRVVETWDWAPKEASSPNGDIKIDKQTFMDQLSASLKAQTPQSEDGHQLDPLSGVDADKIWSDFTQKLQNGEMSTDDSGRLNYDLSDLQGALAGAAGQAPSLWDRYGMQAMMLINVVLMMLMRKGKSYERAMKASEEQQDATKPGAEAEMPDEDKAVKDKDT